MNELEIFKNQEFGEIRTVTIDNEPWFVGKDVADALQYNEPHKAVVRHCDEEDRTKHPILTSGGEQEVWIINESGVYSMIMGSKLDSAKRFKHWVTSEVLPTIRKHGRYEAPKTIPEQIQLLALGNVELDQKIDSVKKDLQDFKQDMPLLGVEESRITTAVKKRGLSALGGKTSAAYQNASLRGKVYSDIHNEVKRQFGVSTYKAIKRSKCEDAIAIIDEYELPICLEEEIKNENAQMYMESMR